MTLYFYHNIQYIFLHENEKVVFDSNPLEDTTKIMNDVTESPPEIKEENKKDDIMTTMGRYQMIFSICTKFSTILVKAKERY